MATRYAEVIGDPVAHSKSPLMHRFWLQKLGLEGDYRPVRVAAGELAAHLAGRCADPFWRGCSVTAPLKELAARLATDPTGICRRIGAANAIFRSPLGCGIGANTDMHGIAAALDRSAVPAKRTCLIGSGGAARAVLEYLRLRRAEEVSMVVRDVDRGRAVHRLFARRGGVHPFSDCAAAIAGADLVINATPLGMAGMPPMPASLLAALAESGDAGLVFDMVYAPVQTPLLLRAKELGREAVDGLTMLIGQAAPAFELFFGAAAPREHDAELRERLVR